jgi:fructose-1,6-bisphosphatase/inositol monophosphatase family enzyme
MTVGLDQLQQLARDIGAFLEHSLVSDPASRQEVENGAYAVDLAAEEHLRTILAERSLDLDLLLEDSPERSHDEAQVLVADVLDGSTNAVRRVPVYNVSLALGKPALLRGYDPALVSCGVIFNPQTRVMHWASRGHGAFRSGQSLSISDTDSRAVGDMVVGAIFSTQNVGVAAMLGQFGSFRVYGCATEHICGVARGDFDAYIALHNRLRVVDVAGAMLIAEEAGCAICSPEGVALKADNAGRVSFIVAKNSATANAVLRVIAEGSPPA